MTGLPPTRGVRSPASSKRGRRRANVPAPGTEGESFDANGTLSDTPRSTPPLLAASALRLVADPSMPPPRGEHPMVSTTEVPTFALLAPDPIEALLEELRASLPILAEYLARTDTDAEDDAQTWAAHVGRVADGLAVLGYGEGRAA